MTRSPIFALRSPKKIHIVSEFPLNSTGKIAKKVLREQLESEVTA